ncbi:PREDICTED: uncharacterized protein LOC104749234 [Camelina sativa]|uniref:Uncharacterized protein LOC104749234 n=1 Tax=Camelina sativa TaxID=90675 RepID=A0ABM0WCJ3_CAMSA|nr:PREDICTED: uncharacterized protein LOC104749234 [Camelina sativa]
MSSSMTSENAEAKKICVFWDVVECPIPDGLDPDSVYRNIESALEKKGCLPRNVSIRAYGDKNHDLMDEFLLANIMFLPAGDSMARFRRMGHDFFGWGINNRNSSLMVISRDNTEFASSLRVYKKTGFNILVAQPENGIERCPNCRKPLEEIITDEWLWESLSAGGDPTSTTQEKLTSSVTN